MRLVPYLPENLYFIPYWILKSSLCLLRSSSTMEENSSGPTYGIMFVPMWTNFTLSRNSSTVEEAVSTATSLALMIVVAL